MLLASYLRFVNAHRRFVTFGFLTALTSSFGQTYFIGIFGPGIQVEFDLSHTTWGTIYMVGTLASAALLPWTGKQIDRLDLRHYTVMVCLLMICACISMAFANGIFMLTIAIFLLRQSGQGLLSHIAITSMARYFDASRGRAIALVSLGFSAGEATLPFLAVLSISFIGWRWSYGGIAIFLFVVLIPVALWLLKGQTERHHQHLEEQANAAAKENSISRTRSEVLHDPRFYLLLPGVVAPALVLTGLFFHNLNLADAKGWSHSWITGSYVVFALASVSLSLLSGMLVDRFGAFRLVPFMLIPLTLGLLVVASFDNRWIAWVYLTLIGFSIGIAHTAVSALWAEIYGIDHLGAIKSLVSAFGVFASALGPVIMGALMDWGMSIESTVLGMAVYTFCGTVLMMVAIADRSILNPRVP
ncbi:MAG: MFS transporter [SAR324 cluster bacterium]|nr:MFS transporter [SAR324 cluster bacterium]